MVSVEGVLRRGSRGLLEIAHQVCPAGWCWWSDHGADARYTAFWRRTKKSPHAQMSPRVKKNHTGQLPPGGKLIKPSSGTQRGHLLPRKNWVHVTIMAHRLESKFPLFYERLLCFQQRMKSGQARTRRHDASLTVDYPERDLVSNKGTSCLRGQVWSLFGEPAVHLHREMARSLGPSPPGRTCVFCVGICNKRASALKSNVSSKASSAPCTPLSTRLFAYSLRPMERIQRITRSLLQTSTSAGNDRLERSLRKLCSPHAAATKESYVLTLSSRQKPGPPRGRGTRLSGQPTCCARTRVSQPLSILVETVLLELIPQASLRERRRLRALPGDRGRGSRARKGKDTHERGCTPGTDTLHTQTWVSVSFLSFFRVFVDVLFSRHITHLWTSRWKEKNV